MFFDENEIIKPEKFYNSNSENYPHFYYIALLSADNIIEKIINTGKHVEVYKSHYTAPKLEFRNKNSLYLYTDYWDGEKTSIGYEITVNLSTDEVEIVDYRPEYTEQ